MRLISIVLTSPMTTAFWSVPITYFFEGPTDNIVVNQGNHNLALPLIRDDGAVIINGDKSMDGQIVFDPTATRHGAAGNGYLPIVKIRSVGPSSK
ncbi:hypothetical protein CLH62_01695 [Marinobacter guineae]|uniref:Uncharacterized protein n=1 Tax=Marinobacter guineae TaxID=432303 RepID=A0A2G1VIJ2_9GAMM|nr:hypothetical protein CLH62_01695 [Marinobacter guineae]